MRRSESGVESGVASRSGDRFDRAESRLASRSGDRFGDPGGEFEYGGKIFNGSPDATPDRSSPSVFGGAGSDAAPATATHVELSSRAKPIARGRQQALQAIERKRPQQATGRPWKATERPWKATERPWKATERERPWPQAVRERPVLEAVRTLRPRELPDCLADLRLQTPARLFAIGDIDLLAAAPGGLVAIVGTREASPYGLRVAKALARAFAEAGAVVVSGLARGIDSAAHEGALEVGGKTIAVLGTGPDVPYPSGNRALHARIAASGLILSESAPGQKAYPGCFPRRNRIIAALAVATIVVEAGHKSGALNTATQATELGRVVAGIPGPIDLPRSAGVNHLLRDGAHLIASVADALALLGLSQNATHRRPEMGADEAEVWSCLGNGPASVDALSIAAGLPIRRLLEAVSRLELAGLVIRLGSGEIGRSVIDSSDG